MSKIILGGGLSGLSAAYYLLNRFPKQKILLLESSNRTGGWVKSNKTNDGTIFENGPRTIRVRGEAASNTLQIIENLGIENEIIPIKSNNPSVKNRMIYVDGKLHKLPSSLWSLFYKTPPFSKPIIFSVLKDIATPKKVAPTNDESIYDFTKRRFGVEIADYIISPMICGICAGNAKEISVKFLMETLFDYEQNYGTVTQGAIKSLFQSTKPKFKGSKLYQTAIKEKWSIYSFKNGMDTLPNKLTAHIQDKNVEIKLNTTCNSIEISNKEVVLHTPDNTYKTDHVFCCIPAYKLGELLYNNHPTLSKLLQTTSTVDVAVINLKFKDNLILEPAFGYLIPPKEKLPVLGVIYDSCCNPQGNATILTAMLGGYWFEKYLGRNPNEEKLISMTLDHLKHSLNIVDKPVEVKVNILKQCIPQYNVGHKDKLNQIKEYIKLKNLPLTLCGASYDGVGVNDVILSSKNAVYNL